MNTHNNPSQGPTAVGNRPTKTCQTQPPSTTLRSQNPAIHAAKRFFLPTDPQKKIRSNHLATLAYHRSTSQTGLEVAPCS